MTTDIQDPPSEPPAPADNETKLALDDFTDAIGDVEITSAADGTPGAPDSQPPGQEAKMSGGITGLEALYDIPVNITVVLGRTLMEVTELLALNKGDVVELDRRVGEAIDIFVNNRLVARGEVVLVEDRLGVTMTEIIKGSQAG
jgi:flagellar motor switch protein FliN